MENARKRHLKRVISLLLTVCLTVCCTPVSAYAWKNLTHVTTANLVLLEMLRSNDRKITLSVPYENGTAYTYTVPNEYYEALEAYPEAFRAGAMGPDFYPDMLTGQGYIHPYGKNPEAVPGAWITLLCDSVNMMPEGSEERKRAISFTLGFMFHYCGDMFAHDFVNQFAGGTFPSVTEALSSVSALNIMLSHMSEETYVDSLINWDFYNECNMLKIDAPIEFISDTMLYDGAKNNGSAHIYNNYGGVPAIYVYLINLRSYLYKKAEEMRPICEPAHIAAVMYLDAWIEDLDNATDALVRCFNSMANRMVTVSNPNMAGIITDEITNWFTTYGKYITPLPDATIDLTEESVRALVKTATASFNFIQESELEQKQSEQIKSLALTHIGIPGLDDTIQEYATRMNDPSVQLDHPDNPFSPADKSVSGNFKEFRSLVSAFADEGASFNGINYDNILNGTDGGALDNALDSDLVAFYNSLTMFKLILIGPDNFKDFIRQVSGVDQTQYQKNTAELCASSLSLNIVTADKQGAGTDDNIYAVVYDMEKSTSEPIIKKLLDKSGKDDFENGRKDSYTVELGEAVKLSNVEVDIVQESTELLFPEWDCESISITPYHAGAALVEPIGFGGRYGMKAGDTWKLCFNDELMLRTQISDKWNDVQPLSANVTIETDSAVGSGTDDNVTLEIYNGIEFKKSISLDKDSGNDFEAGSKRTYGVPLADNINDAIPLDKLNMKLTCSGNTASGEWKVKAVDIILYHGEMQLTDTINCGSKTLDDSTWDLELTVKKLTRKECTRTPIVLSYDTNVDDGMLNFVYSLDGSHQYINSNGLLWRDPTVRKEVFFKIFKGFSPDIKYDRGSKKISENEAFNMDFTLEGMWNGTGESRRNKVYYDPQTTPGNKDDYPQMPKVSGNATISFINYKGDVIYSVTQTISSGEIHLKDFTDHSLTFGTYSVKVSYEPDSSDPMYASAVETFENILTVTGCGHAETEVRNVKRPNCTEKGYTGDLYCAECNELLKTGEETAIDPDAHDFDYANGEITKESTYFSYGEHTYYCKRNHEHKITVADIPLKASKDGSDYSDFADGTKDLSGNEIISGNDADGNETVTVKVGGEEVSKVVTDEYGKETVTSKIWVIGHKQEYRYTGMAQKPAFRVYDGTKRLTENTDFTVRWLNNKNVGTASIILKFKGNYSSAETRTINFEIKPAILGEDIIACQTGVAAKKSVQKPVPALIWAETGKKVPAGSFKISYYPSPVKDAGTYTATITPAKTGGNFDGSTTALIKVTDKSKLLSNAKVIFDQRSYAYTGKPVTPKYSLKSGTTQLKEGTDYRLVSLTGNTGPGTATLIFEAISTNSAGYVGSKIATFRISGKIELKDASPFEYSYTESVPFAKGGAKPAVTVKYDGTVLKEGTDYTVSYAKNRGVTSEKTAEIRIRGKGSYKGTVTKTFAIKTQSLKSDGITVTAADRFSTRTRLKAPSVTITDINGKKLSAGTDYTIGSDYAYTGDENSGTVTFTVSGKGSYYDDVKVTYSYKQASFNIGRAKAVSIPKQTYTGNAVKLSRSDLTSIVYTGSKGAVNYLEPGKDFEVKGYSNNVNTGTAKVIIHGIGDYAGTKTLTFKVIKKDVDYKGELVGGSWK